ncbi:nucleoside transporter-domain-containing protein [Lipomyces oligophaga]|uniref:nucleoside transporter-domain-containing protein n=1 Tax=Lipomyces oligophaga TaxID=45792 RepID=UPI0034CE333A
MESSSDPASRRLLSAEGNPFRQDPIEAEAGFVEGSPIGEVETDAVEDEEALARAKILQSAKESYNTIDYYAFLFTGLAMLWPWNCFLSAAAYFQDRFAANVFLSENFTSAMMTTSTITATVAMLVLSRQQLHADYEYRIWLAFIIMIVDFSILAIASLTGESWSLGLYFVYLLVSVFFSALATALSQNGAFAIANLFSPVYTQAIMVGQAVSGVLPSIAQIITVVSVESSDTTGMGQSSSLSSFVYFLAAVAVAVVALFFVLAFYKRHKAVINHGIGSRHEASSSYSVSVADSEDQAMPVRKYISLLTLFRKLHYSAFAVFFAFAVTLLFPVFASTTLSVNYVEGVSSPNSLFRPNVFIPIAILIWNIGDLVGRLICGFPQFVTVSQRKLAMLSLSRLAFIPIFFFFNINGTHAVIRSDFVYLFTQLLFGITNGYVGSCGMMNAELYVLDEEKEATGGFMALSLNLGLTAGSLASFVLVALIE